MEKLEFGYNHGFTNGIMMVSKQFDGGLLDDMKRHNMRVTGKTLSNLIKVIIENRETLRENPFAFVRCNNNVEGGFEVYVHDKYR